MTIASWNVNSVRARLPRVIPWLEAHRPDVLCMQETKVIDEEFPHEAFAACGYRVEAFGQKTYNGVALATRAPAQQVVRGLPGDPPAGERRLISARIGGVRVVNVYVPNGTALGSERFAYKLRWFERLRAWLESETEAADPVVVCGDFNVAPEERDVHDPEAYRGQLHFHPDEHAALRHLMAWGLIDALRLHTAESGCYTWWDYRGGAFHRGMGLRIDLMLVTRVLAERCRGVTIDREARKGPKPSDHAPLIGRFAPPA